MARLLPDPPSRTGGILTRREMDAALRVLDTLRRPQDASVVMSWDNDMQDALGSLKRAQYVETRAAYGGRAPRKTSASFRPDVLATTPLGAEYLDSIRQTQQTGRAHATKKRSARLDREIAEVLAKKVRRGTSHATKSGPSWKQIAADYKRRAQAAREAGGHVKIYPYGAISILPVEGAESDYYYEDWQYDELMDRTKRENKELLKHISLEDLLLAQSQEW